MECLSGMTWPQGWKPSLPHHTGISDHASHGHVAPHSSSAMSWLTGTWLDAGVNCLMTWNLVLQLSRVLLESYTCYSQPLGSSELKLQSSSQPGWRSRGGRRSPGGKGWWESHLCLFSPQMCSPEDWTELSQLGTSS